MRLTKTIRRIESSFYGIGEWQFMFLVTMLFYALIWRFNPGNKLVFAMSAGLLGVIFLRIRRLAESILVATAVLGVISTGKSYNITLIPPGMFPIDFWPNGYIYRLTFTPGLFVSLLLIIPLLNSFLYEKLRGVRLRARDILLILFFSWTAVSNLFVSVRPDISGISSFYSLITFASYLALRISPYRVKLRTLFAAVFCALLLVEGFLAIQQFFYASPTGLSIETQQNIELFGEASDEIPFRYRPTGTFGHANAFAESLSYWMLYIAPAAVAASGVLETGALLLGGVSLILTLSRAAWVGAAVGGIFLYARRVIPHRITIPKNLRVAGIALGSGLLLFAILPRLQASVTTFSDTGGAYVRQLEFQTSTELISSHPFFGVGAGMSVPESLAIDQTGIFKKFPTPIHNAYVLMIVEGGIPALFLFLCFVLLSVRGILRANEKSPYILGGLSALLALGIEAVFQPYGITGTAIILLALIAPHDA